MTRPRYRQVTQMSRLQMLWTSVVMIVLSGLLAATMALLVFNEKTCEPPYGTPPVTTQ